MFEISTKISTPADAARAAEVFAAIRNVFDGDTNQAAVPDVSEAAAPVPRATRTKKPDPVAAYVEAGGTLPLTPVEVVALLTPGPVAAEPAAVPLPQPSAAPVELVDCLAALRSEIRMLGHTYLQPLLAKHNVDKLSLIPVECLASEIAAAKLAVLERGIA